MFGRPRRGARRAHRFSSRRRGAHRNAPDAKTPPPRAAVFPRVVFPRRVLVAEAPLPPRATPAARERARVSRAHTHPRARARDRIRRTPASRSDPGGARVPSRDRVPLRRRERPTSRARDARLLRAPSFPLPTDAALPPNPTPRRAPPSPPWFTFRTAGSSQTSQTSGATAATVLRLGQGAHQRGRLGRGGPLGDR